MKKIENVQVLAGLILKNLEDWHNDELGYEEVNWSDDAPNYLIDAFEDVLEYDGWRYDKLRQYAFYLFQYTVIDESIFELETELDHLIDWLKADDTSRAVFVERTEKAIGLLVAGNSLKDLFFEAQRLELQELLPKFSQVFDSLTIQG